MKANMSPCPSGRAAQRHWPPWQAFVLQPRGARVKDPVFALVDARATVIADLPRFSTSQLPDCCQNRKCPNLEIQSVFRMPRTMSSVRQSSQPRTLPSTPLHAATPSLTDDADAPHSLQASTRHRPSATDAARTRRRKPPCKPTSSRYSAILRGRRPAKPSWSIQNTYRE